ncbi:Os11g0657050 [Oryza sativa Japonica Group]|uniref:Os11g0657050 protein n=1 Tax=Oryza sativa subsp. japonica TaxID=39947 RepID=A0A0P0Y575_ORYSJ|nr:hypothetical protein EE612_056956 [Oryza sativa]BAT15111.1 Os11g0657050 [Oryza sativa Japonica Group]
MTAFKNATSRSRRTLSAWTVFERLFDSSCASSNPVTFSFSVSTSLSFSDNLFSSSSLLSMTKERFFSASSLLAIAAESCSSNAMFLLIRFAILVSY